MTPTSPVTREEAHAIVRNALKEARGFALDAGAHALDGQLGRALDALDALEAASRAVTETPEGLDVAVLRQAAANVNDMDPVDYLDRGDFIDALAAEYARLHKEEHGG